MTMNHDDIIYRFKLIGDWDEHDESAFQNEMFWQQLDELELPDDADDYDIEKYVSITLNEWQYGYDADRFNTEILSDLDGRGLLSRVKWLS